MTKNLLNSIVKINGKIKFIFAGSSQMFGNKKGVASEKVNLKEIVIIQIIKLIL